MPVNLEAEDHKNWLEQVLPVHKRLADTVQLLLENMLRKETIEFLNVTCRVKDLDGAIEKIRRKSYSHPKSQLTDLTGVRVVTYLESHVGQISKVIRGLFEIDEANSL